MMQRLAEEQIKAAFINRLVKDGRLSSASLLANEFSLGREGVRADLAVLGECFIGVEVKSEFDSLRRLANQVACYERFFDTTIVVLNSKYFKTDIWPKLGMAEVWEITSRGSLKRRRVAKNIKAQQENLANLLTKSETRRASIRNALNLRGEETQSSARRALSKEAFTIAFERRFGDTSRLFWETVEGRSVIADDLRYLSRFGVTKEVDTVHRQEYLRVLDLWGDFSVDKIDQIAA